MQRWGRTAWENAARYSDVAAQMLTHLQGRQEIGRPHFGVNRNTANQAGVRGAPLFLVGSDTKRFICNTSRREYKSGRDEDPPPGFKSLICKAAHEELNKLCENASGIGALTAPPPQASSLVPSSIHSVILRSEALAIMHSTFL